jgi:pimeloyl-ACP methyl ester carboxylesterase
MPSYEINEDNPVLTGIFAHYCGPWEWEKYVKELFAQRGYDMLNPDLPIDDLDITENEFAAIIREKQKQRGAKEYVDLGHSWGGEKGYRMLDASPVSLVIFLGSPLREVAERAGIPKDLNSHSILYHALARAEEEGGVDFEHERELIGKKFFSDLGDTALQAWATARLRPHPHKPRSGKPDDNAVLSNTVPMHYVGFKQDQVYFYTSQQNLVKNLLEKYPGLPLEFSSIPSGHFPMLENPVLFVDHIIKIIEGKKEERQQTLNARLASS